jgi:signal transduction histidine kinase
MAPMNDAERILEAVVAISSDLELGAVLRRIVSAACDLAGAQYGALGVLSAQSPVEEIHLIEFITEGIDPKTIKRIGNYPHGRGILGLLIREPRPLRLHDLHAHPQSVGFPANHPPMRSFLGVPVRIRDQVFGNLYLTEKRGGGDFTAADEELVTGLAHAAGVAIENARLHDRVRGLAVLEDRERIARDLHDTVIQRLFATGMSLQGLSRLTKDTQVADRIQQAVDDLDDTIRDIRGAIFALQAHERGEQSVRVMVLALASEAIPMLGFEPRVHFDGPVDSAIEADLFKHLLATLRELLSNVTKHARATAVDIYLRVGVDVSLAVIDNGAGITSERKGGHGLRNLRQRARSLGGELILEPAEDHGTVATWRVPRSLPALS